MHVSKQSTLFKFLDTNWFTKDATIPSNLCPFMRRALGSIVVNILVIGVAAWLACCVIMVPLSLFIAPELWGELWVPMVIIGAFVYGIAGIALVTAILSEMRIGRRIGSTVSGMNSYQTTVGWAHAIHDKVCPRIEFK